MSTPARIVGYINRSQPWGVEQESHVEHLARTAADAVDDISLAVFTANTKGELALLRNVARTLIAKLDAAEVTSITLEEHFDDMRRTR